MVAPFGFTGQYDLMRYWHSAGAVGTGGNLFGGNCRCSDALLKQPRLKASQPAFWNGGRKELSAKQPTRDVPRRTVKFSTSPL